MGDHSRYHPQDLLHILGFGSISRACKSFLSKCHPDKHFLYFRRTGNKSKSKPIEEDINNNRLKNQNHPNRNPARKNVIEIHDTRKGILYDNITARIPQWGSQISTNTDPSPLTRTTSHGCSSFSRSRSKNSQAPAQPAKASLMRAMSHRDGSSSSAAAFQHVLSGRASRTGSTTIVYSNSNGLMKPAPMEQQLDCTLEELCFGCIKKVKITRDAVTDDGQIVKEDEVFTIKVQPGWKKGTKIKFEGKGNEMLGTDPADVIFIVSEKEHPLFKRREDDIELGVEILLVDALTGCTLLIPLLGNQTKRLVIDDIVYPGYQKIVAGQGMPKQNEQRTRGNLIITVSIKFPEKLTEEQRSIAANILQQAC